jgi:hypothetical protein
MKLRKDQRLLVWACVAALALWIVTPLRFLLLPLIYYNTHIHELCHAIAAIVTGGQVGFIEVFGDGSGLTQTRGGSGFLIASAGYVGSSIVGGILVFGSRTPASAKKMLLLAAAFIAFAMVFFVRGDAIGIITGFGWLVALGLCSKFLNGDSAVFAAQFLGIQQCLTSFQSFLALIAVTANDLGHSDAANMEEATHVPAILWSLLWLGFGLFAIGVGIKASWANRPPPGSV